MRRLMAVLVSAAVLVATAQAFALDLIKDGRAVSTIVVPDKATAIEQNGAETLVKYLKMSSGAELAIVKESAKPAGALISLGKTQMAQQAGVTDEGLKYDGYRLVVKGGTLYLLGRDTNLVGGTGAQGSLRAAFGLLDRLGFRWLQPVPMGTYTPTLKTVSLPDDLNVTYEPKFMFMYMPDLHGGDTTGWGDCSMANSFRTAAKISWSIHSWLYAVPADLFKDHPEYFMMRDGKRVNPEIWGGYPVQFCMSNPDAQRLVADWTIKQFDLGYDIVGLGQTDGYVACQCPICSKLSASDQVHNALRNVAEMVAKKYPDRLVHLLIYNPCVDRPSQFKTYPPNTLGQVCLCEMVQTPFGSHDKAMDYWRSVIPGGITVFCYNMGTYYNNGLAPRFYPELAAQKIQDWVAHGVQGIFWCGGGENWGAEGPTYYVIGRMATDPTQDWKKLVDEYCTLTFGKAAQPMEQYYSTLYDRQKNFRHFTHDWVVVGVLTDSPNDTFAGTYSAETLLSLRGFLDAAKKEAAGDERALSWIRVAEISYNQYAGIATTFHYYQAYMLNPTAENLKQVGDAVKAYRTWADETRQIGQKDKAFADNFFPNLKIWTDPNLNTNYGHLACAPFNWDFEKKVPGTR